MILMYLHRAYFWKSHHIYCRCNIQSKKIHFYWFFIFFSKFENFSSDPKIVSIPYAHPSHCKIKRYMNSIRLIMIKIVKFIFKTTVNNWQHLVVGVVVAAIIIAFPAAAAFGWSCRCLRWVVKMVVVAVIVIIAGCQCRCCMFCSFCCGCCCLV